MKKIIRTNKFNTCPTKKLFLSQSSKTQLRFYAKDKKEKNEKANTNIKATKGKAEVKKTESQVEQIPENEGVDRLDIYSNQRRGAEQFQDFDFYESIGEVIDDLKGNEEETKAKERYLKNNNSSLRAELGSDFYNKFMENQSILNPELNRHSFRDILKEREEKLRYSKGNREGQLEREFFNSSLHEWDLTDIKTDKLQRSNKEDAEILLKDDVVSWNAPYFSNTPKKPSLTTMGREDPETIRVSDQFNNFQQWKQHIDVYSYWWHQATSARWHAVQIQEELFDIMPQLREILRESSNQYSTEKLLLSFNDERIILLIESTIKLGKEMLSNNDKSRVNDLYSKLVKSRDLAKSSTEGFKQALGISYSLKMTPNAYAYLKNPVYAKMSQVREIEDQKLRFINDKEHSFLKTQQYVARERLNMNKLIVWLNSKKQVIQHNLEKLSQQSDKNLVEKLNSLLKETQNLLERKSQQFEKSFGTKPDLQESALNERVLTDIYSRRTENSFHLLKKQYSEQREKDLDQRCLDISNQITEKYRNQYSAKNDLIKKISIFLLSSSHRSFEDRWSYLSQSGFNAPFFDKIIGIQNAKNAKSAERERLWAKYTESIIYNVHYDNLSESELSDLISAEDSFYDYCMSKNLSKFEENLTSKFRVGNYFSNFSDWFLDFFNQKSKQMGTLLDSSLVNNIRGLQREKVDFGFLNLPNPLQFLKNDQCDSNPLKLLEFYQDITNPLNRHPKKLIDGVDSNLLNVNSRDYDSNPKATTDDLFSLLSESKILPTSNIKNQSNISEELFDLISIQENENTYATSYQQVQNFLLFYRYEPLTSYIENVQYSKETDKFVWTENNKWITELPEVEEFQSNNTNVFNLENNLPVRHALYLINKNRHFYKDQWAQVLNLYLSHVIPSGFPGHRWVVARENLGDYYVEGKNDWHNKTKYPDGFIRLNCQSFVSDKVYTERYVCLNLEKGIISVQMIRKETIHHGYKSVPTKYKRRDFLKPEYDEFADELEEGKEEEAEKELENEKRQIEGDKGENTESDGDEGKDGREDIFEQFDQILNRPKIDNVNLFVPRPLVEETEPQHFHIEFDLSPFWLSQLKNIQWPENQYVSPLGKQFTQSAVVHSDQINLAMQNETTPF
eukprot:TRINITY_DN6762_c0_g1_i1.p1 TRINITY_DN6762_c0_g1~~TRINITY_DN6762_c0_g1_i1.p1  ORF type:complete len:1131 (-),score=401.69 TRINITY_DN6762_c0_g1_i1:83-3475(-)